MKRQHAIEQQAIDWLIRQDEPDWSEAEQAELAAWLDESMAHKAAFWRVEHGWREADRVRSLGMPAVSIADAVDEPPLRPHRPWLPAAIAASLVASIGLGGYALAPGLFGQRPAQVQQARYETQVGGRRIVPLADGSKVELNTRTVLRATVTATRREIWLDTGEAYFEVAHRGGESFVVHAGRQTVTVLGTKFSVRRERERVTVNVLEGRVRVGDGENKDGRAAIIVAGDTAISRGPSTLIAPKSEERVENALAWRGGMLSFDQTRLLDVAVEFNRYNRTQLIVTDPAVASIPIGGTFQAANVDAFVRLLRDAYGLSIQENAGRIQISR